MQEIGEQNITAVKFLINHHGETDDSKGTAHVLDAKGTRTLCGRKIEGDNWRADWSHARHFDPCGTCDRLIREDSER